MSKNNGLSLNVAEAVGKVAKVETKLDRYSGFFITKCEILSSVNVCKRQLDILRNDPDFADKNCYLITAAQNKKKYALQRRFIITEDQFKNFIRPHIKEIEAQKIGVISDKEFNFKALGQYLEKMFGIKLARIYPRVKHIGVKDSKPEDIAAVNNHIKNGKINANLKLGFFDPSP